MKWLKKYLGYEGMCGDIADYGYVYSRKKYSASMLFVAFLVGAGGVLFQLKLEYIMVILLVGLMCLPAIIKAHYYTLHQQKRFRDVDGYLHQMIYSFQKQPKINVALEDAYKISDGMMKDTIGSAMDELNYGVSQWVYTDALSVIEEKYGCDHMTTLHRFLVNVEEKGGQYSNSINVLLKDFDRWVKRIYQSQEDIKKVKRDISIGIIISVVLAATTVMIAWILKSTSNMNIGISDEVLYQIFSSVYLVGCIFFYTYTQVHYGMDWLVNVRKDSQIKYDLKLMTRKKGILYKGARRRIVEDLYSGFSEWLRNVALGLQEKTLQAAIKDSYESCPCVMRGSLENFIDALELDPSDVTPYYEFLREFQVPDIAASVRTLYGLSQLDHANMDATINTLISRNYELQDKHECLKQTDRLSMMKFSEYIPVFMVSVKMGIDMMLLLTCYL